MSVRPTDAKVLIVEDESIVAHDIGMILEGMGVTVTAIAQDAANALDSIAHDQPDLVLLDLSLSGRFEGVELAREIDRRWQIPVVFISGHLSDVAVRELGEFHAAGYVVKPFYPVNLREAVASAISALEG
jgi:CheY-like chemotaxis protein